MLHIFVIQVELGFSFFAAPLVEADKETDEQNYIMWRLENGVAESSAEIPKGNFCTIDYLLPFYD